MDLERLEDWMVTKGYKDSTVNKYLRDMRMILGKGLDVSKFLKKPYKISGELAALQLPIYSKNNAILAINVYLASQSLHFKLKKTRVKGDPDRYTPTDEQVAQLYEAKWKSAFFTERNRMLLKLLTIPAFRCDEARSVKITDLRFRELRSKKTKTEFLVMYLLQIVSSRALDFNDPDTLKKRLDAFLATCDNEGKEERIKLYYINVIGKGLKERNVPIPEELYHEAHRYFNAYHRSSDYLFDNGSGRPISTNYVRKTCTEAGEQYGIPQFHPHAGRRWRAGFLRRCGVEIDTISKFLGHESVDTTIKHYLTMIQDDDRYREINQKDPLFNITEVVIKDPQFKDPFNFIQTEAPP